MTYTYDYQHPAVTVDIVIFTIVDNDFKVLLIQRGIEPYEGMWALPGGFVGPDESLRPIACAACYLQRRHVNRPRNCVKSTH